MPKGCQSNGFATDRGRVTIIAAATSNGVQSFSPVLPGIETQADSGDYSIRGLEDQFAVERKSVDDLANCCLAGRFDAQAGPAMGPWKLLDQIEGWVKA